VDNVNFISYFIHNIASEVPEEFELTLVMTIALPTKWLTNWVNQ